MKVSNYLHGKRELKRLFAENGLHIKAVAEKTGVSRPTICGILEGKGCSPIVAKKICDAFEISMWDYFEMEE